MAGKDTMRLRIQDEWQDEFLSDARVNAAIESAIKHYERREFYFTRRNGSFNTVADDASYNLITDAFSGVFSGVLRIRTMTVTQSGIDSPVLPIDRSLLTSLQTGSVKGLPTHYTTYITSGSGQFMTLYPIPDAVYAISIQAAGKLANGSADELWFTEAEELIRYKSKVILAIDVLNAPDLAEGPAALERAAFAELMAETRRRDPEPRLMMPDIATQRQFNIYTG